MEIKQRKIDDLIFAEYNPRQLSKAQFQHLKDSLSRFGFVDPVIVNMHKDRKNIIVGGHQRVKVWQEMGKTDVPTVEVNLARDKERELNVRLNKNTGSFDFDILANEFEIEELTDWGFSEEELTGMDFGTTSTEREGQGVSSTWEQVNGTNMLPFKIGDLESSVDQKIGNRIIEYCTCEYEDNKTPVRESILTVLENGINNVKSRDN